MPPIWLGLLLAFASALVTNTPLALVQAVVASGVAVLAFTTAHGHPSLLARREQLAVVLAITGLALLASSLAGMTPSESFACLVASAVALGHQQAPEASEPSAECA